MRSSLATLVLVLLACGNRQVPPSAPSQASAPAPSAAPADSDSASTAEPPPEPKRKRPLGILNGCAEVVTLVFGEDPKAPSAGKRTVGGGATTDGPRDDAGNVTVWLLDPKGEPIAKVHVTRGMKKVEIGRSCRTLDAR